MPTGCANAFEHLAPRRRHNVPRVALVAYAVGGAALLVALIALAVVLLK